MIEFKKSCAVLAALAMALTQSVPLSLAEALLQQAETTLTTRGIQVEEAAVEEEVSQEQEITYKSFSIQMLDDASISAAEPEEALVNEESTVKETTLTAEQTATLEKVFSAGAMEVSPIRFTMVKRWSEALVDLSSEEKKTAIQVLPVATLLKAPEAKIEEALIPEATSLKLPEMQVVETIMPLVESLNEDEAQLSEESISVAGSLTKEESTVIQSTSSSEWSAFTTITIANTINRLMWDEEVMKRFALNHVSELDCLNPAAWCLAKPTSATHIKKTNDVQLHMSDGEVIPFTDGVYLEAASKEELMDLIEKAMAGIEGAVLAAYGVQKDLKAMYQAIVAVPLDTNQPPAFVPMGLIEAESHSYGTLETAFQVQATDPDEEAILTYSVENWVMIDDETGEETTIETYPWTFSVDSETGDVSWFIMPLYSAATHRLKFVVEDQHGASDALDVEIHVAAKPICSEATPECDYLKTLDYADLRGFVDWNMPGNHARPGFKSWLPQISYFNAGMHKDEADFLAKTGSFCVYDYSGARPNGSFPCIGAPLNMPVNGVSAMGAAYDNANEGNEMWLLPWHTADGRSGGKLPSFGLVNHAIYTEGSSGSQNGEFKALAYVYAAMRPEVRDVLLENGTMTETLISILQKSMVDFDQNAYMSSEGQWIMSEKEGSANAYNINVLGAMQAAAALTLNSAMTKVTVEVEYPEYRDNVDVYSGDFSAASSGILYDVPGSVSVAMNRMHTQTLIVTANAENSITGEEPTSGRFEWVPVLGDGTDLIDIVDLSDIAAGEIPGSRVAITFTNPAGAVNTCADRGKDCALLSVAAFFVVQADGRVGTDPTDDYLDHISMPVFINAWSSPYHELEFDDDGNILSATYNRNYVYPSRSYQNFTWTEEYFHYTEDANTGEKRFDGFTRVYPDATTEEYDHLGRRILEWMNVDGEQKPSLVVPVDYAIQYLNYGRIEAVFTDERHYLEYPDLQAQPHGRTRTLQRVDIDTGEIILQGILHYNGLEDLVKIDVSSAPDLNLVTAMITEFGDKEFRVSSPTADHAYRVNREQYDGIEMLAVAAAMAPYFEHILSSMVAINGTQPHEILINTFFFTPSTKTGKWGGGTSLPGSGGTSGSSYTPPNTDKLKITFYLPDDTLIIRTVFLNNPEVLDAYGVPGYSVRVGFPPPDFDLYYDYDKGHNLLGIREVPESDGGGSCRTPPCI